MKCAKLIESGGVPDEPCLQAAAHHVKHDFELLRLAWKSRRLRVGWTLWFVTARGLMDFFFRYERRKNRNGGYQDDILAGDYLSPDAWRPIALGLTKPDSYASVRDAANKLATHLTYSRVDLGEHTGQSPSADVHNFLLDTEEAWLDKLEANRRAWFAPP